MRGLVFVEELQLSGFQWAALLIAMGLYCSPLRFRTAAVMAQGLTAWAFWGSTLSVDVRLLFDGAAWLQRVPWAGFLSEFAHRNYVFLQPPFFTFAVSRFPDLRLWQLYALTWALLCVALLFALFGKSARWLAACPVWLLMGTQPSNDLLLFGLVLCVLRLCQMRHRFAGALVWGLAYPVKPFAVLLLPFVAVRLRAWALVSLIMWGVYVKWSLVFFFGVKQWEFLLHQFCLR